MAKPRTTRLTINPGGDGATALASAPIPKIAAVTSKTLRLPKRSAAFPPTIAPTVAPNKTPLTTISSAAVVRPNSRLMKMRAPEMTPVSYPNRRPPNAPNNAAMQTNLVPRRCALLDAAISLSAIAVDLTQPYDREKPDNRSLISQRDSTACQFQRTGSPG